MTILYKDEVSEQLPATDTTLYTAPSTVESAHIIGAVVCCEDATGDSITVNIVQSGGSVAVTNQYIQTKAVAAGATENLVDLVGLVLKPSDFISAVAATANRLNVKFAIKEIYA